MDERRQGDIYDVGICFMFDQSLSLWQNSFYLHRGAGLTICIMNKNYPVLTNASEIVGAKVLKVRQSMELFSRRR